MNKQRLKCISLYILFSLPLALPIMGIMYLDGQVLADGELMDPVVLSIDHPLCVEPINWCLIIALIAAFTPFKRISSLAAGMALGLFAFYGIDIYSDLKDISDMGFSKQPLIEMVKISTYGKWLIAMCILCAVTQAIYGIVVPALRIKKANNLKESSSN